MGLDTVAPTARRRCPAVGWRSRVACSVARPPHWQAHTYWRTALHVILGCPVSSKKPQDGVRRDASSVGMLGVYARQVHRLRDRRPSHGSLRIRVTAPREGASGRCDVLRKGNFGGRGVAVAISHYFARVPRFHRV
eukprot:6358891-Prymnesium_polylepis.3